MLYSALINPSICFCVHLTNQFASLTQTTQTPHTTQQAPIAQTGTKTAA